MSNKDKFEEAKELANTSGFPLVSVELSKRFDEIVTGKKKGQPKTAVEMLQEYEAEKRARESQATLLDLFFKFQSKGYFGQQKFWTEYATPEELKEYNGIMLPFEERIEKMKKGEK